MERHRTIEGHGDMRTLERHRTIESKLLRIVSSDETLVATLAAWAQDRRHPVSVASTWLARESAAASPTVSVGDWDPSLAPADACLCRETDHAVLLLSKGSATSDVPVDARLDVLASEPTLEWSQASAKAWWMAHGEALRHRATEPLLTTPTLSIDWQSRNESAHPSSGSTTMAPHFPE